MYCWHNFESYYCIYCGVKWDELPVEEKTPFDYWWEEYV